MVGSEWREDQGRRDDEGVERTMRSSTRGPRFVFIFINVLSEAHQIWKNALEIAKCAEDDEWCWNRDSPRLTSPKIPPQSRIRPREACRATHQHQLILINTTTTVFVRGRRIREFSDKCPHCATHGVVRSAQEPHFWTARRIWFHRVLPSSKWDRRRWERGLTEVV
jgi:hypothetical protein